MLRGSAHNSEISTYPNKHGELEQSRHWVHPANKKDTAFYLTKKDLLYCNITAKPEHKNKKKGGRGGLCFWC